MDKELKIEEYKKLLTCIHELCNLMPDLIFNNYFDTNKYLYSLYFEAFNSIKGVCVLFGNGGLIPQVAAVLRMAIEQTATIRVLELHKEIQKDYIEHRKLRFELRDIEPKEKRRSVIEYFGDKMDKKDKERVTDYLDYGWLKTISNTYGLNELIDLSKIQEDDAIKKWKQQLNNFVHGHIEFTNLTRDIDAPIIYCHSLIDIVAKLFDILIVEFHNENRFNFIFNNIDYRKAFRDAYKGTFEEGKAEKC